MASGKSKRIRREPRDYQKQTFWLRSVEGEYLNERGELAAFTPAPDAKAVWVTECRDCGAHFDQTLRYYAKFKPDTRCPTCAAVYRLNIAMGLPVKPFPLPKAPKPRKQPTAAQLAARERRKAKRAAQRKARAERKRETARRKKVSHKAALIRRRIYRAPQVFAKRVVRLALRAIKREARIAAAADWIAQHAPKAPPVPKQSKATKRKATRDRVAAHRTAKRAAAGLPPPRGYKKRRSGPLNESERKAAQREYMRQYRKRQAGKKAPRPVSTQDGA